MYVTIRVRCPWCDKSHEAPFHLTGKKVRCKNCTGVIKIPGEAVASPLIAAPSPVAAPSSPPPARAAVARVSNRIDSPPPPPANLFDLDDDPSPPRRPPTLRQMEDDDYDDDGPLPERVTVGLPPREEEDDLPGKGRKRKKRRRSGEESTTWEKAQTGLLVLGLVGCLLILGLGLFVPGGREIAVLLSFLAGMAMMMVGGIWSACIPFQESTRCGLMYLFVPFYAGYYTKTRFSEMFTPFLINIFGAFLFYMATLGPMNQLHEEPSSGMSPAAMKLDFRQDEEWLEDNGDFNIPDSGESPALPGASDAPVPPPFPQAGFGGRRGPDDH